MTFATTHTAGGVPASARVSGSAGSAGRRPTPQDAVGRQLSIEDAIAAGERGMALALDVAERSEPNFAAKAEAAMVAFLRQQPTCRAPGEDITEHVCRAIGCRGQALGAVYKRLIGKRLHVTRTDLPRRHGHASIGGKEYALIEDACYFSSDEAHA